MSLLRPASHLEFETPVLERKMNDDLTPLCKASLRHLQVVEGFGNPLPVGDHRCGWQDPDSGWVSFEGRISEVNYSRPFLLNATHNVLRESPQLQGND